MNRFILYILFSIFVVLQSWGKSVNPDLASLAKLGKAKVEVDFSDASIHGMSEEDFQLLENDWMKDKPEVIATFLGGISDGLAGVLSLGSGFKTPFTVRVNVLTVSGQGDYTCDVDILKDGKSIATIERVKADGGSWGSKLNLIKDGAKHTGEQVGRKLRKLANRNRK